MLAFTNSQEKISPTIIGAGCKIKGNIETNSTVQIHGEVTGNIIADTVVIGLGGKVTGQVTAKTLFLHGTIDGPVSIDIANVFNNAQMTGVLCYKTLNITGNTGLECKLKRKPERKSKNDK